MRLSLVLFAAAGGLAAALASLVAWYYTTLLRHSALRVSHGGDARNLLVTSFDGGLVGLRPIDGPDADLAGPATFGLEYEGGRGKVGPPVAEREGSVIRPFEPLSGPGPRAGAMARLDSFVFGDDPRSAHGVEFREVTIETPGGFAPAWETGGRSNTWAVVIHGKGAGRREALRIMPSLAAAGLPVLVPTYHNDPELGGPPDGHYTYGEREWPDIEAAVAHAVNHGAERIVLVGFSMGASIALAFLRHSPLAARVVALIFDSPMLSFRGVVEARARAQGMPAFLVAYGRAVASRRFGLDWRATDYRAFCHSLNLPILLFHGDADPTIAIEFSDELAAACPDRVTFLRTPGARHVRSWNMDPAAYDVAVQAFLAKLESGV